MVRNVLRRLHHDERGAVSLETILIIGAVAVPVLIFLLRFGWPRIRDFFTGGLDSLNNETEKVTGAGSNST